MTRLLRWIGSVNAAVIALVGVTMLAGHMLPSKILAAEAGFRIYVVDAGRALVVNATPRVIALAGERHPLWSPTMNDTPLYGHPVWSRDGKRLAFHKWYSGDRVGDIMVENVYTGEATRYTAASNYQDMLSWGPHGEQLAYIFVDSPDPRERLNVALLDLETGRHYPITYIGQVVNPSWSPDGALIAFRTLGKVSVVEPHYTNDPGVGRLLTEDGKHQSVTWSPDGSRMSLLSYSGTHDSSFSSVITVLEPDANQDTLSCDQVNPELYAVWSPDWRYLATHTAQRGLTVVDMQTCDVTYVNGKNSGVKPLWTSARELVFASGDVLYHANVATGHKSTINLPGTVGHIAGQH